MDLTNILLHVSFFTIAVLFILDIKYSVERIIKMDRLMRLVRRGEVSYIQFVNEVLDNIVAR